MNRGTWWRAGANVRTFIWRARVMDENGIREQKKMLRRKVRDKLSNLTAEEIASQCVCALLCAMSGLTAISVHHHQTGIAYEGVSAC